MKQIIFIRKLKDYFLSTGKLTKVIILLVLLLLPLLIYGNYQYRKTCRGLVDVALRRGILGLRNINDIKNTCWESVKIDGNYRELYAYYKIYKYVDDINNDKGANSVYHWMLFYANENSKRYNNGIGLYEKELQNFEDMMTQEEKIKAFSYIADNIATGKEGWVKKHDYHKSFEYLKKAAEAGDRFSQAELGACYFGGGDSFYKIQFPKDYVLAYKWTYISMTHSEQRSDHYKLSDEMLKIIASKADKEKIEQAKKESVIWISNNAKFVKNNPLKILKVNKDQIEYNKNKTQEIIKKYINS